MNKPSILYFDTLPSTNDHLKTLALAGAEEYTAVIADHQSQGRGRRSKSFFSPEGTGLYMSFLVYPEREKLNILTPVCALSVRKAIKELYGINTDIKWVNDLYLNNKKLCGILCESSSSHDGKCFCIVGIGINLTKPKGGFPKMEDNSPTALFKDCVDVKAERDRLAERIIKIFPSLYASDNALLLESYKKSCFVIGKNATVKRGEEKFDALILDINPDFSLRLKTNNKILSLNSGEISLRLK
ncbi:MAG: biotin--[acetyl-CoA-carboxylase] ligase [Ruminococcaceae bacterium]|nr:biotin--[acetyl-CoA-carboxylase] ligase [Oscillospiraceae bacterium]